VSDVWIGLEGAARRRNWWLSGFATVLFAVVCWALAGRPNGWVLGVVAVFWLVAVLSMLNRSLGRIRLTAEGMEFHTFLSRRRIPWAEITKIDKRYHAWRGGRWWDVYAVRTSGRALRLPGVYTVLHSDAAFERNLERIIEHWKAVNPGART
jgi:hypothetical protein